MPFNQDGSWTGPSGKTYPKGVTADQMPRGDRETFATENDDANNPTWHTSFDWLGEKTGLVPSTIDSTAPGATLDTSLADAQRQRQQDFVTALQQQAATGDGAWRKAFEQGVQQTRAAAQSLGQSDSNVGYGAARRNIGNAQSAASQRAVGDEQQLRAQSQLDARNQLGDVLGGMAQSDIGQSAESARVERQRRLANQALVDQSLENRQSTEKGISGAFGQMASMSDGGRVPGRAQVFGNDSRNDTVPAMLSPGEIVIPRSITAGSNASEGAARFVAAVKAHGGAKGLAGGGDAGIRPVTGSEAGGDWVLPLNFLAPHVGRAIEYENLRKSVGAGGGGTLDASQFRQTAGNYNALASLFGGQAAGEGPSVAMPQLQRHMDDSLAAAQAAQVRGGPSANDVLQSQAAAGEEAAAGAGRTAGGEQSRGQAAYARALQQRRGQEMQFSSAQQQAAWEKTLADAGLNLKNQAALRGTLSGAGQAAAAFSGQGRGDGGYRANPNNLTSLSSNPYPDSPGMDPSELSDYPEQGSGLKSGGMAYGGIVGMAGGGEVEDELQLQPSGQTVRHVGSAPKRELTDVMHAKESPEARAERKRREHEEETGDAEPATPGKKPTPREREGAFAKAVRSMGEYAKRASGMVRGMAEGGYVFEPAWASPVGASVAFAPGDELPPVDALPPRRGATTGAALGLGGGFDPSARVSMPPQPDAVGPTVSTPQIRAARQGGAPIATGMKPAPAMQDTLVQVGEGPDGSPIVEKRQVEMVPELKTLKPKSSAVPAPAPAEKPKAATGAGVGPSGAKADAASRAAAQAGYEADKAHANAQAEAAAAQANAFETQVNERKALAARVQQDMEGARTRYDAAQKEMARIDTTVDPGRFWATRSTGDKVVGILGLVLGALGAGPDGINRAAVMLNDAVNRDLEAQRAEHELRLKKGAANVDSAKSYYAMAREAGGDELSAMDLAHAAALKGVIAKGEQMIAKTGDAQAKARLGGVLAAVEQGAAQRATAGWEKAEDRKVEREKIEASKQKASTPPERMKVADDVNTAAGNIKRNAEALKKLVSQYGTQETLTPGVSEDMDRRSTEIATELAKMLDPSTGVRDPEMDRWSKLVFKPGYLQRDANAQATLDNLITAVEERRQNALRVRGMAQ